MKLMILVGSKGEMYQVINYFLEDSFSLITHSTANIFSSQLICANTPDRHLGDPGSSLNQVE
jgi:hypothetical protein